jgi:DNA-binding LacI/PurR family transcriptional regulator
MQISAADHLALKHLIGMIIPDITNPYFPAVVRGAEDVAFSNG